MGIFWAGVTLLGLVVGVLSWLRFTPDGPGIVASVRRRVGAYLPASRREVEELSRRVDLLDDQFDEQVAGIELPETGVPGKFPLGDLRNAVVRVPLTVQTGVPTRDTNVSLPPRIKAKQSHPLASE